MVNKIFILISAFLFLSTATNINLGLVFGSSIADFSTDNQEVKSQPLTSTKFNTLPHEILVEIVSYLTTRQQTILSQVNHQFKNFLSDKIYKLPRLYNLGNRDSVVEGDHLHFITAIKNKTFKFSLVDIDEKADHFPTINNLGVIEYVPVSPFQDLRRWINNKLEVFADCQSKDMTMLGNYVIEHSLRNAAVFSNDLSDFCQIFKYNRNTVTALNHNGSIAIGYYSPTSIQRILFTWSKASVMKLLPSGRENLSVGFSVNDNGNVIVGQTSHRAAIWFGDHHYNLYDILRDDCSVNMKAMLKNWSLQHACSVSSNGKAVLVEIFKKKHALTEQYLTLEIQ